MISRLSSALARLAAVVLVEVLAAVAVLAGLPAAAATGSSAAATTLFRLSDPRIDEASGIGRGIASPGVFYVQNDSGDVARFFALDAANGEVRAVYTISGAHNDDWEDLAVAPDARGVPSVWLADIGDNDARRGEVQIYRVDEPRVDMARRGVELRIGPADVWRLRYPSGPVDAESLAVTPRGRAYIVTKVASGRSTVYAVPDAPDARRVGTMAPVGSITITALPSLIPPDLQQFVTGAAFSRDGTTFVVRTYTDAYLWTVGAGALADALRRRPVRITLPLQPQGEGVCIVGNALVLDSERAGSSVYRVPIPARPSPPSGPSTALSSGPPGASTSRPRPAPATLGAPLPGAPGGHPSSADRRVLFAGLGVLTLALAGAALVAVRRRRTRA